MVKDFAEFVVAISGVISGPKAPKIKEIHLRPQFRPLGRVLWYNWPLIYIL